MFPIKIALQRNVINTDIQEQHRPNTHIRRGGIGVDIAPWEHSPTDAHQREEALPGNIEKGTTSLQDKNVSN